MSQSTLSKLRSQAENCLYAWIDANKRDILAMDDPYTTLQVIDIIGAALDTVLDEREDTFTLTLLLCCLEDSNLFTQEPKAVSCILDDGQVNAQHCVYHNLYDLLSRHLEQEFTTWLTKEKEESHAV